MAKQLCAKSIVSLMSFIPAAVAFSCTNSLFVELAIIRARVVLPVPGGP